MFLKSDHVIPLLQDFSHLPLPWLLETDAIQSETVLAITHEVSLSHFQLPLVLPDYRSPSPGLSVLSTQKSPPQKDFARSPKLCTL